MTVYHTMMPWEFLHPRANMEMLGYIPYWLDPTNPKSAREQLNDGYAFGGFKPFKGFTLDKETLNLLYSGDPPTLALAKTNIRDEMVVFYQHSWVAVIQPDFSFEVCRMT